MEAKEYSSNSIARCVYLLVVERLNEKLITIASFDSAMMMMVDETFCVFSFLTCVVVPSGGGTIIVHFYAIFHVKRYYENLPICAFCPASVNLQYLQ